MCKFAASHALTLTVWPKHLAIAQLLKDGDGDIMQPVLFAKPLGTGLGGSTVLEKE